MFVPFVPFCGYPLRLWLCRAGFIGVHRWFRFFAPNPTAVFRFMAALAVGLAGCARQPADSWQGYLEGEYVRVAAPLAGTLTSLKVKRGETVQKGQALFELEHAAEADAVQEAEQRLAEARARRDNLLKGRRPSELKTIEARLAQAKVALDQARTELARRERIGQTPGAISPEQIEQARAQRDAAQAQMDSIAAELETARLGAREDEIKAAEAGIEALQAAQAKARWALDQKRVAAPAGGVVDDTLYREGEFVAAGSPVVSLLPPANIKVRFFLPQERLAAIQPGTPVSVSFDGAPKTYTAKVNYVAAQAEFTPPVIYSQQTRAKLVFMIEAVRRTARESQGHDHKKEA